MNGPQLGLFLLEASVMISIVLVLFRARTVLGLTPLYIVLGGFQYLEATLNLRAEIVPGFSLNPASSVMFPATLATAIIIYVKHDALEARKLLTQDELDNPASYPPGSPKLDTFRDIGDSAVQIDKVVTDMKAQG